MVAAMSRTAPTISCDPEVEEALRRLAASRTEPRQTVERARMVLGCLRGQRVNEVAARCGTRANTVIKWRQRFVDQGLKGLQDAPRPGAKPVYDQAFRKRVLAILSEEPALQAIDTPIEAVLGALSMAAKG